MPEVDCVRSPDYRYPFRTFPGRLLYAGCHPDGHQVLVGPLPLNALILWFSAGGDLERVEKHALPELRDRDDLEREVITCFEQTGASPGLIRIHRFSSGDPGSLLADIELSDDPHSYVRIEIVDLPYDGMEEAEEQRWLSSGAFVLEWGDSYYVGADGQVFST
jgi:hypothetical protein